MVNKDDKIKLVLKVLMQLLKDDFDLTNKVKAHIEVIKTKRFTFLIGKN